MSHVSVTDAETDGVASSVAENTSQEWKTILLVEDETFVRSVTCEVLQAAGYRVLSAMDAVEAMNLFHQSWLQVGLVLTDMVMPGRSGGELAIELRKVCPKVKIIFTSGYPEDPVPARGLSKQGTYYLPKPFSAYSLARMVRQVLEDDCFAEAEAVTSA